MRHPARRRRAQVGESGKDFAKRLLVAKYGEENFPKGPGSEFGKIQKWGDRSFEREAVNWKPCFCYGMSLAASDENDEKLVGVYRTEDHAKAAIDRVKNKPGFRDASGAFEIAKYELDKDHWAEGFVTV